MWEQGASEQGRRAGVVIHVALVGVISPGDRRGPIDRERVKVDESELAAQRFVVGLVLEDVGLEDGICQGRVESVVRMLQSSG